MINNKEKIVFAKAPMRFDLAGGPTDVSPFAEIEGGLVINVAISKYAFVKISTRTDDLIKIRSIDIGLESTYEKNKLLIEKDPLLLICAAISYLMPNSGIDIETFVDAPVGSGLGASAALTVALVGALNVYNDRKTSLTQIAIDSLHIENNLLKITNGGQDQFASTFGGFNLFTFDRNGIKRKELLVDEECIKDFENRCLLVYSGETRVSGNILNNVMQNYEQGFIDVIENLRKIKFLAKLISYTFIKKDISDLGKHLMSVLTCQMNLHPSVVSPNINKILKLANTLGVEGAKIAGAGGGGMVLLYSSKEKIKIVSSILEKQGYMTSNLTVAKNGLEYREVKN